MKTLALAIILLLGTTTLAQAEQWGVVFGGDKNIGQAQYEVNRAKRNTPPYPRATIFYRSRWYRNVILFNSKKEAQAALSNIHRQLRQGSYIINVDDWCPNWKSNDQGNSGGIIYYQCY